MKIKAKVTFKDGQSKEIDFESADHFKSWRDHRRDVIDSYIKLRESAPYKNPNVFDREIFFFR